MASRSVEIFIKGFNKADRAFQGVQRASERAFKSMKRSLIGLGIAAGAAAAGISALVIKGVRDFGQFGHEMASVSTMIRTNVDENTAALAAGVQSIASEIPQSTSVLTVALYDILSASVPVNESMRMLKLSGKAAVAGLSDVQTAANLATGTINALGLAFSDADKVFDLAFSTVRSGKVTFSELAFSLGQVLPSASKMNAGVEEVYGSIAFLTKNAMRADMASISLARAFDAMGQKAAALKAKMGIQVFGEAGEYVGIVRVMEQIADRLKGLTEEAKVNVLEQMGFDIRAARAITIMSANLDAFKATMTEVKDSAGAMQDAYDKMKDTLINQWKILMNNLQNLGRTIGKEFGGAAATALRYMTAFAKDLNIIINGAGGLRAMWKKHGDDVIEIFGWIAGSISAIMLEALKGLGRIIVDYGKRPIEDLTFYLVEGIGQIFKTIAASRKMITGGFSGMYAELERMREESDKKAEQWNLMQEERMDDILRNVAESAKQSMLDLKTALLAAGVQVHILSLEYSNLNNELEKTAEKGAPPIVDAEALNAALEADAKILKMREKLASELDRLTKSETQFKLAEIERWRLGEIDAAKGNQKTIDMINQVAGFKVMAVWKEVTDDKLAAWKEEAEQERRLSDKIADYEHQIHVQTLRNLSKETEVTEAELKRQAEAIYVQLGETDQAREISARWFTAMWQAELDKQLEAEADYGHQIHVQTLRNLNKETEATEAELKRQAEAIYVQLGETDQAREISARWFTAMWQAELKKQLEAEKETGEKREQEAQQRQEQRLANVTAIRERILQAEEEYYLQSESLKEDAFELEQERIKGLADQYNDYTSKAINLANIFQNAQQRGWLRTLASLIRFAAQQKATYLEREAMEKLKQAGELQTRANQARAHAARMAELAAEAEALGVIYGAQALFGDVRAVKAAEMMLGLASKATAEATKAMKEVGVYEAQAKALQAQAATLMKAAATVKAAGELTAEGLEMAADRADAAAEKQEEIRRKEQARIQEEQRVQQRIMEMEGRTGEMRMRQLDEQIRKYEETGVSTALLHRLRALEQAEIASSEQMAAVGGRSPAFPPPAIVSPPTGTQGAKNVVYQTVTFNSLVDTSKQESLREQAEQLAPYLDEVRDRYEA